MDKYIKAQDAINAFAEYLWAPLPHSASYANLVVEKIPTADVVPIRHGYLKYCPQDDTALCSECDEEIYLGALHQFAHNYCPNCGAKMDEGEQDG